MAKLKFEDPEEFSKNKEIRSIVPISLNKKEKDSFSSGAKELGWSLAKYMRVSTKVFYLLMTGKVDNFMLAYEQALLTEPRRMDK